MSPRPVFWYVCLQVHPTTVSHFELTSATEKYIHLCAIAGFARPARTLSFVAAKTHAVHGLLSYTSWPVEQFQAGKHSTFRTPSVARKGGLGCRFQLCFGMKQGPKLVDTMFVAVCGRYYCTDIQAKFGYR